MTLNPHHEQKCQACSIVVDASCGWLPGLHSAGTLLLSEGLNPLSGGPELDFSGPTWLLWPFAVLDHLILLPMIPQITTLCSPLLLPPLFSLPLGAPGSKPTLGSWVDPALQPPGCSQSASFFPSLFAPSQAPPSNPKPLPEH